MKKTIFFIAFIQSLVSLSANQKNVTETIKKHFNGNGIVVYPNLGENIHAGYNNCNFLNNGENLIIRSFIKKNDIIFDVGANRGEWTKAVLDEAPFEGKIYCFEPILNIFQALEKLKKQYIGINGTVNCFNTALGKKDGELTINYFPSEESCGCSTFFERPLLGNITTQKVKVKITSLDLIAREQNISHINFLKIDTEGSELNVLLGAKDLIENNNIDVIQFEYGGTYLDANIKLSQVYDFLKTNNYLIFRIISQGLIFIDEWNDSLENFQYSNYLALKADF